MTTRAGMLSIAVVAAGFLLPVPALAAVTFYAEGPDTAIAGSEFPVLLKARVTEAINALKVTVLIAPDSTSATRFDDSSSSVRLWLHRGTPVSGGIQLEGVIPGGIGPGFTDVVELGTVWVRPDAPGNVRVTFADAQVYLNQPTPTLTEVTSEPLDVRVTAGEPSAADGPSPAVVIDAHVRIVRDAALSDGARSVVFDVKTDRGTADSVLVRERWFGLYGTWHEVSSPSTLSDGIGLSILDVALPESMGRARVTSVTPWLLMAVWTVSGALVLLAILHLLKKRH